MRALQPDRKNNVTNNLEEKIFSGFFLALSVLFDKSIGLRGQHATQYEG